MDLLLLLPITIFAIINVVATAVILHLKALSSAQRLVKLAFIWIVPILGSVVCLSSAAQSGRGFTSSGANDGAWGGFGGGHGDGGSSGCGDGGGGAGGDGGSGC